MPRFDRLFCNPYLLTDESAISVYLNPHSHLAYIVLDRLLAEEVDLGRPPQNLLCDTENLIKSFRDMGYLQCYTEYQGKVWFTYATRQVKRLLTQAGRILEVYTYHKAKELGSFNDIAGGYEIIWGNAQGDFPETRNEFDCILTKGFRVLFVECKATRQIQDDFYFRLSNLAGQFGIQAKAVLVADTREKDWHDIAPVNAAQRSRGGALDVVTIWKQSEISNIGQYLLKVMDGTYESEQETGK